MGVPQRLCLPFASRLCGSTPPLPTSTQKVVFPPRMRLPRIIQRVEAAKKEDRHHRITHPGIVKTPTKKKRADKLRALAGAFTAEAHQGPLPVPIDPLALKYDVHERIGQGKHGVTWHTKKKRWSNQTAAGGQGELAMLVDQESDCNPLVACPLEWQPSEARARANSL